MMTMRSKAMVGLVLLAGVLLISGTGWAQAAKYPLPEVELEYWPTAPPGRMWITEGGIMHLRDIPYELEAGNGDLEIHTTGVCNHNRNLVTGDGNFWGDDQTVEVTWGELTGTFRGSHSGKTIANMGYSTHVYHGISGDFEGMKLKLSGTWDFIAKNGVLEGTLMVTGAVHADPLTVSAESASASTGAGREPVSISGTVDLTTFAGTATLTMGGEELAGSVQVVPLADPVPKDGGLCFPVVEHWFSFPAGNPTDILITTGEEFIMPTGPEIQTLHGNMEIIPESEYPDGPSAAGRFEGVSGELRVNGVFNSPPGMASFEAYGTISR